MDQHPQLKYPPRTMTRKGEQLFCLSPEGRSYVDQVVQIECGGRYLEVPGPMKEKLAAETGVSYAQIQNYLRNKHQSIRAAQATPTTIFAIAPPATQHPSLPSLSVKPAPEGARKAKELLLFGDIPEAKLDRLHALLHLTPDATEFEALDWAEPLELSENRVLAWFRYQRKSGASQSPPPPTPEEVDELNTPRTLVKHELSPEATVSDARSRSRAYSPGEMGMDSDEDQLAEIQASRLARPPSEQSFPSSVQTVTLPSITQLPTPTTSASTSPNPPEGGQTFAQLQKPKLSPSLVHVVDSAARPGTAGHSARPDLEDGEIAMENVERRPCSSPLPTVGFVPMTRRDPICSVGDRTGNSFPVLTPAASRSPDLPFASPTRQSPSRGGAHSGRTSWNTSGLSHSRQPSWEDSSRQQEPGSRNGPPSPYRGYGKGKARERFDVVNEHQEGSIIVERGLGPHRDRPRPPRLQTHPYHVHLPTSSHRDRYPPSTSTSDATTPSTSRSVASSSTGGSSASPPFRGPDACRIIQAVSIALRDLPALSARMDVDSIAEDATSTVAQNVEKIQEFNSWAIGAAKSLGVSLQALPSRGSMPPPPNPASSSSFRK